MPSVSSVRGRIPLKGLKNKNKENIKPQSPIQLEVSYGSGQTGKVEQVTIDQNPPEVHQHGKEKVTPGQLEDLSELFDGFNMEEIITGDPHLLSPELITGDLPLSARTAIVQKIEHLKN